jgi:xylulokinase
LDVASGTAVTGIVKTDYDLSSPTPEAVEIQPEHLWQAVLGAAQAVVKGAGGTVDAVGLSCLTPALVLLDKSDQPLGPIWTHLDRRSRPAARQIHAAVGDEFLAATGNRPLPGGISVVCWRQQVEQDPYLIREVASYLHLNSWLAFRMTGEKAFDPANASFSGLFATMTDQRWSSRWCEYFEVNRDWLPHIISGRAIVGTLRAAVGMEIGLPAGLPMKLGTADTSSAMLAARMKVGDLLHVVGATQVLAVLVDRPSPDPRRLTRRLGVDEAFVHVTHNPVGGMALEWLHKLCFQDQSVAEFYEQTVPAAMARDTRVSLDPPFLGGDRLEIEAHRAAFRDLTISTDRLELLTAILKAMRQRHYEAVKSLGAGASFRRVFLTGGGANTVRRLLPEYAGDHVHPLDEGSLRGIASLFP